MVAGATACAGCGGTEFDADGWCDTCGRRAPVLADHDELDLGAAGAGVTDIGHRHRRNEDAMGIVAMSRATVAVVCDGVSTSSRPDAAAAAAIAAALPALWAALESGGSPSGAIRMAARAAQAAVTALATRGPRGRAEANPPSCTLAAAVLTGTEVTVGWLGDSRAYWLPGGDDPPTCLTADDSLAGRLGPAAAAVPALTSSPYATALLRWLGADAPDARPHLATLRPPGAGRVILCSDGLSRYLSGPDDLAAARGGSDDPLATARALVDFALARGGGDNVTVVVLPFPPPTAIVRGATS